MRKTKVHILFCLSILLLVSLCANAADRHYFRTSLDFSYARDFSRAASVAPYGDYVPIGLSDAQAVIGSGKTEALRTSNGFAPALGLGYRLAHGHFLFDVGVGAEYRQMYDGLAALTNVYEPGVDEEGMQYMGHHSWTDRTAVLSHAGVSLPVMIGGEWGKFYFLAGAKAAVDIWGRSEEKGLYSLEGDYDRYMNAFSGMPAHGFVTDEPYATQPENRALAWGVRACAEIGYCIAGSGDTQIRGMRKTTPKWYVSLFGEYGVTGSKDAYTPMLVGVRVTMLMPLPAASVCKCLKF